MKNPWNELITNPNSNLVLSSERAIISEFNSLVSDKFKIHTDLIPAPFMGDVKNAMVVILVLNPGYDENEMKRDFYSKYKDYWISESQHHFNTEMPLFCLDDEYCSYSDYWAKVLNPIVEQVGKDNVAKNVCKIQLFPYQSKKFKPLQKRLLKKYGFENYLPSQKYSFELVKKAMERNALIILPRAEKKWKEAVPELALYDKVCKTNSYLNITLSEKNLGSDFQKIITQLNKL